MNPLLQIIISAIVTPAVYALSQQILNNKRSQSVRLLSFYIVCMIGGAFIPLLKFDDEQRLSVINLIQGPGWELKYLGIAYIISALLLYKNNRTADYISAAIYFTNIILSFFFFPQYIPDSVINNEKSTGLTFVFVYVIIPMGLLLCYLPLIFSSKYFSHSRRHR